jgi:hypothetical protein
MTNLPSVTLVATAIGRPWNQSVSPPRQRRGEPSDHASLQDLGPQGFGPDDVGSDDLASHDLLLPGDLASESFHREALHPSILVKTGRITLSLLSTDEEA